MEVKRVSKGLFLVSYTVSILLFTVLLLGGYSAICFGAVEMADGTDEAKGQMFAAIGGIACTASGLFYIIAVITLCVLCYKMWAAIRDGDVRTTPGQAVGFLFIPFFNLYWFFQSVWGWSQDYNKYIESRSIQTKRMPERFFLATCILCLCSCIPCVGFITALPAFIMSVMVLNHICNGINALADATPSVPGENPEQPTE